MLLAAREFLSRYGETFKVAWSVRSMLDPPKRSEDELAFLPAHLELTDSPVSPMSRWIMRVIMVFFCVALIWAILGDLDIVAVAPGKTVVGSRTKIIQTAETAVVKRILVRDGQAVTQGEVLIELDATATGADFDKADETMLDAQLEALRLQALAESQNTGKPPILGPTKRFPKARFDAEQALATSQFAAYQAKCENLLAAIRQRKAEVETVRSLIGPLAESAKIATTRAQDYAKLVEDKYVGRHDYLMREQERIAAERDLAAQNSRLVETQAALGGAREELEVLNTDMRQQTLDDLRQAQDQIRQFVPEVAKARQRNELMQLRAPVSGTIQQLAIHTVGGVVTPAQPILAIVPENESLEVEATVLNKDIGFIRPGQQVAVKVESFPYTRYGYLEGVVEMVSHDAVQDEKLGLIFPIRVRLKDTALKVDGVKVWMTPGMILDLEIKTGRRSLISYLLSPLQEHSSEAMRER